MNSGQAAPPHFPIRDRFQQRFRTLGLLHFELDADRSVVKLVLTLAIDAAIARSDVCDIYDRVSVIRIGADAGPALLRGERPSFVPLRHVCLLRSGFYAAFFMRSRSAISNWIQGFI